MSMENQLGKDTMNTRRGRLGASPELLSKQYLEPGLGTLPAFTIITATYGRKYNVPFSYNGTLGLKGMFSTLLPQLGPNDEVIIVSDGYVPDIENYLAELAHPQIRFYKGPSTQHWGNEQRQLALPLATKDYILFCDDDDTLTPDYLESIRQCAKENPGRPICFYMEGDRVFGKNHSVELGHIGGPMMAAPNVPGKLGNYASDVYAQDHAFITETLAFYKDPPVWIDRVLYNIRGTYKL
jgi:glycosyltransferase involved in cell wall biosynthesis